MTVNTKRNAEELTLSIEGRIDTITAPSLEKTINENIEGATMLVLDFKEVQYVSSAGLRVLLAAQKTMQQKGSMKLLNVCEEVLDVFEMTGFVDILTIE